MSENYGNIKQWNRSAALGASRGDRAGGGVSARLGHRLERHHPRPQHGAGPQAQSQQNKTFQQGIGTINQRLSQSEETNAQLQAELKLVTDRLKMTQGELANARQQARQIRTEYSTKFDTVQTDMATKANAADVTTLGGDLTGVKSDLEAAKNGLQMTRGEFGTLIARNHDEIDQLRRMGERDTTNSP